MKRIVCIFVFAANIVLAQDEIILRKTFRAIWDELEIQSVTSDSIIYLPGRRKSVAVTLPLKEVIAYRRNYEGRPPYIFPNAIDQKNYKIKNGRAIDKEIQDDSRGGMQRLDIEILLRPHLAKGIVEDNDLENINQVTLVKIKSGRKVRKRKKAKLYIILKEDPSLGPGNHIAMSKYKFTTDSMLFFKRVYKKEVSYYSVKLSEIKAIGIQTPGMIVTKIILGTIESLFLISSVWGINTLIHPMYRKFRIKKWSINVAETPLQNEPISRF